MTSVKGCVEADEKFWLNFIVVLSMQVRERCRKEWGIFQTRMAEAEKAYYEMMGVTPPNVTFVSQDEILMLITHIGFFCPPIALGVDLDIDDICRAHEIIIYMLIKIR